MKSIPWRTKTPNVKDQRAKGQTSPVLLRPPVQLQRNPMEPKLIRRRPAGIGSVQWADGPNQRLVRPSPWPPPVASDSSQKVRGDLRRLASGD